MGINGVLGVLGARGFFMSGLIKKLGATKNENRQEYRPPNPPQKNETAFEKSQPANPCNSCGATLYWIDIYGGGPYCFRCNPYPTERLVRGLLVAHNGRWHTIDEMRAAEATQDKPPGQDAICGHPRLRKLITMLPGFRDLETWWECQNCRLWFSDFEISEICEKQKGL